MKPRFFKSADAFRAWLERNHAKSPELWIGYYKVSSSKRGITYKEAVDQALCFGWIDGKARTIDAETYCQRFTPRKARSTWSKINVERVKELRKLGLVHPAGLRAFEAREHKDGRGYSYEEELRKLSPAYEKRFRANKKAWAFWSAQPPGYRRTASWWVMSAKKEETRLRRLTTLIEDSKSGRRLAMLATASRKD